MFIQWLRRVGVVAGLAALVSGCSMIGSGSSGPGGGHVDECKWNRSRCLYEGSYEPGERDYAEQQAKRLNQAASERLRRSGG